MNLIRQIQGLRDTAFKLALDGGGVWHTESGVRGSAITTVMNSPEICDPTSGVVLELPKEDFLRERHEFRRPSDEHGFRAFMKQFLCTRGKLAGVIEEPWRTFGFPFAATAAGCRATVEQEDRLEGLGHSFIYGDPSMMLQLARLIAVPAVRYLSQVSPHGWGRDNSYGDPMAALGDWIYILYEVGLKTGDANLRRYYRFVVPLRGGDGMDISSDMLVGFDGTAGITKAAFRRPRLWKMLWEAASSQGLAFGRLGTDLISASRIAMDHLLDMNIESVSGDVFRKRQQRLLSKLNDTEKCILKAVAQTATPTSRLTAEEILKKATYGSLNSNFKKTMSGLVKTGLLENEGQGYYMPEDSMWVLKHL